MNSIIDKRIVRTYKLYSESHPNKLIAILTIKDGLFESEGNINILDEDLAPIDLVLFNNKANNINGVKAFLTDRAMPPNRMFFEEYCREHGYNHNDLNDRLKISGGKACGDDFYLVIEEKEECIG